MNNIRSGNLKPYIPKPGKKPEKESIGVAARSGKWEEMTLAHVVVERNIKVVVENRR